MAWTMGFIQAPASEVAGAYLAWQTAIQNKRGVDIREEHRHGGLQSAFDGLLPLTSVERRRSVFIQTMSDWTAYFDNGVMGSDPMPVVAHLCLQQGWKGVCATSVPNSFDAKAGRGSYRSTQWEIYGPSRTEWLNVERTLAASNDGGRWVFVDQGAKLPFEQVEFYQKKRIQDRFTPELLESYLKEMGIRAFDEDFYESSEGHWLLNKSGPHAPQMQSYTLEESYALPGGIG
ncbi:hypothetical protein [Dyella sp. AD56]|uniref:hypothetical protein n=1 Tax=Dyella sp. AD56 TaxID=1528744 RepID=UPI000C85AFA8|nr:hypothetical protein [Dyella sp. AD56]